MKISIWDILSVLGLAALLILVVVFIQIGVNPYSSLNPFPPPTMPALIILPSNTPTLKSLPPTWTATPMGGGGTPVVVATQTLPATSTGWVMATFTPTPTNTATPTNTRTITNTPPPTNTRTNTPVPTYTLLPTYTDAPTATP